MAGGVRVMLPGLLFLVASWHATAQETQCVKDSQAEPTQGNSLLQVGSASRVKVFEHVEDIAEGDESASDVPSGASVCQLDPAYFTSHGEEKILKLFEFLQCTVDECEDRLKDLEEITCARYLKTGSCSDDINDTFPVSDACAMSCKACTPTAHLADFHDEDKTMMQLQEGATDGNEYEIDELEAEEVDEGSDELEAEEVDEGSDEIDLSHENVSGPKMVTVKGLGRNNCKKRVPGIRCLATGVPQGGNKKWKDMCCDRRSDCSKWCKINGQDAHYQRMASYYCKASCGWCQCGRPERRCSGSYKGRRACKSFPGSKAGHITPKNPALRIGHRRRKR